MTAKKNPSALKNYYFIDGYNLIYADNELKAMIEELALARDRAAHLLSEYGAYKGYDITLVFDAPNTADEEQIEKMGDNFRTVYTKAGETADSYIEREAYEFVRRGLRVYVVSSDNAVESLILGAGAYRVPSGEFMKNLRETKKKLRREYLSDTSFPLARHDVSTRLDANVANLLDALRKADE